MSAGSAAEELAMTKAVSVGRLIIFIYFENFLDVTLPVENTHYAQGFRLNDVEDEHVLEILHGPETQPGKGWIFEKLRSPDMRHIADRLDGLVNGFEEPRTGIERILAGSIETAGGCRPSRRAG